MGKEVVEVKEFLSLEEKTCVTIHKRILLFVQLWKEVTVLECFCFAMQPNEAKEKNSSGIYEWKQ